MASNCGRCNHLVKLDAPVIDRDFGVTYRHGCSFSQTPPQLSMQTGRRRLWSADSTVADEDKMLIFSNIEYTTCGAFTPQIDPPKIEE